MDYPFTLKEQYGASIESAVIKVAGSQEAQDILSQFWLDVFAGDCPEVTELQLIANATTRARKAANKRQKDSYKVKSYTENPPERNTFGVLTQDELCKICTKHEEDLLEPDRTHRLNCMAVVFNRLPLSDQEFIRAYQLKKAKELTPRYGASDVAVRQRAFKIKQRITNDLTALIKISNI